MGAPLLDESNPISGEIDVEVGQKPKVTVETYSTYMAEFLAERNRQWGKFSVIWNEVEVLILLFTFFLGKGRVEGVV